MFKLSLLAALSLFSTVAFAAPEAGESTMKIEQPGVLSELQFETGLMSQSPAGNSSLSVSAAKKITLDQNLGIRALAGWEGKGYSAGVFWRRHVLAFESLTPFFETELLNTRAENPANDSHRSITSLGFSIGTSYRASNKMNVGGIIGVDVMDVKSNASAVRMSGGQYLSGKIGLLLGLQI